MKQWYLYYTTEALKLQRPVAEIMHEIDSGITTPMDVVTYDYLKWICGFANALGGSIFVGVNDKKEVVGVENSKKLMIERIAFMKMVNGRSLVPDDVPENVPDTTSSVGG